MLNLWPQVVILTNLEEDHLDYYKNFKNIKKAFREYVKKIPKNGLLIVNADNRACLEVAKSAKCRVVHFRINNRPFKFKLQVPGQFNVYNALAAGVCALKLGIKPEMIKKALNNFKGIWRRFEKIGKYRGALIFTDYAHHPTALKETLKAAKELYPKRKLLLVYQPHHFDRTKRLFKDFVKSFDQADFVILNEIYDVPGREALKDVSSKDLVREIKKRGVAAVYSQDLTQTKRLLLGNIKKDDLVLIVGAGDIYELSTIFS
jgi:UDP-N-acetylmuramate--alanine ligase